MRARRGGLQLHRVGRRELEAEAERLARRRPSRPSRVGEAEARAAAHSSATGGRQDGACCTCGPRRGRSTSRPEDLLLIVRGPIRREYQARETSARRSRTATLEAGYRFHLHRGAIRRPSSSTRGFAFGAQAPLAGSSLLSSRPGSRPSADAVPVDDGFKRLPRGPGASPEESRGLAGAAPRRAERRAGRREGRPSCSTTWPSSASTPAGGPPSSGSAAGLTAFGPRATVSRA